MCVCVKLFNKTNAEQRERKKKKQAQERRRRRREERRSICRWAAVSGNSKTGKEKQRTEAGERLCASGNAVLTIRCVCIDVDA